SFIFSYFSTPTLAQCRLISAVIPREAFMQQTKRQALFISHGGGPMPLMGDPEHQQLVDTLQQVATTLPKPSAILLISAHWEEPVATVTSAPAPGLMYDYNGFPPETY